MFLIPGEQRIVEINEERTDALRPKAIEIDVKHRWDTVIGTNEFKQMPASLVPGFNKRRLFAAGELGPIGILYHTRWRQASPQWIGARRDVSLKRSRPPP